jgi:hypothetical protein
VNFSDTRATGCRTLELNSLVFIFLAHVAIVVLLNIWSLNVEKLTFLGSANLVKSQEYSVSLITNGGVFSFVS